MSGERRRFGYSTELQRDASIEDQIRAYRTQTDRQGYEVVKVYFDRAASGASLMPPGIPELRIIDDELWQAVRSRQGALISRGTRVPVWDRRRPRFLFSGLMQCGGCGGCGGGYAKVSQDASGCSRARNKGSAICTNMRTIKRVDLERSVLDALEHHLMDPGLVEASCKEYTAERNRLQDAALAGRSKLEKELARVRGGHAKLVDAIMAGIPAEQVKDRMLALDARRRELEAALSSVPPPAPSGFTRRWR
ncbi:hypothetical protein A6024_03940 [Rhodovulum sulfidophilum]|nr:hypothetical protein A6W98_03955 [Rhodovulum sulfidophilum DSM 1374]ANB37146.1 hypothetical protein A6024_03940 [Rhodovulum sulfidophilum]